MLPFVTHLPRYSLAVAAGKFQENQEVTEEGWEEGAAGNLTCQVQATCLSALLIARKNPWSRSFRTAACVYFEVGTLDGSLLATGAARAGGGTGTVGPDDRYTVKRYRSEKSQHPDGAWVHERIRLEPLNPEFEAWDLEPEEDRYRILAEFVQVLD